MVHGRLRFNIYLILETIEFLITIYIILDQELWLIYITLVKTLLQIIDLIIVEILY